MYNSSVRACLNLKYSNKRGQFENKSQTFTIKNGAGFSYAEKIAIHLPEIDAVIYSKTKWSNTTNRHQSEIDNQFTRCLGVSVNNIFYFDFKGSCNWLHSSMTKKDLKARFLVDAKDAPLKLEKSEKYLDFLKLFCTAKQAQKNYDNLKAFEEIKAAENKAYNLKQDAFNRLKNFDLKYNSEKTLAKALENYFKKYKESFNFESFEIFDNCYHYNYATNNRIESAILNFNNFIKANIESFFNEDNQDKKRALMARILELESIVSTKETFNAIENNIESEPSHASQ